MNAIFAAAREIQEFCRERGWRFCIIGGLAVQRWGEPRLTRDVDVTLLTGFGGEPAFVDGLLARFTPRLPDARDWRELVPLLELNEDAETEERLRNLFASLSRPSST